jgi:hypothetical protein
VNAIRPQSWRENSSRPATWSSTSFATGPGSTEALTVDRFTRKHVAGALEFGAQVAVVVDLAVLDDVHGAVLVCDRLGAGLEIDDREAACREADRPVHERPVAVRGRGGRASR